MIESLEHSVYFGVFLSLGTYAIGLVLKKKLRSPICNPLLISVLLTVLTLLALDIDYDTYYDVCLAVPLYRQLTLLKNNWRAILAGITCGVLSSLGCVLILSMVLGLDHQMYVTLLPKSITTAIAMGISEEMGGLTTIMVAVIIVTGILGAVIAEGVCKLFHIDEPIAKGTAIGTSAHAMGTSKALEMGEIEGAMSSLAIAVAGLLTVVLAPVFAGIM